MDNYWVKWDIERNGMLFGSDSICIEADTKEKAIKAVIDLLVKDIRYVYCAYGRHFGALVFQDYRNTDCYYNFTAMKVSDRRWLYEALQKI